MRSLFDCKADTQFNICADRIRSFLARRLALTAAFLVIALSGASAQFVDWRGSALVTNATNCTATAVGDVWRVRYRHPKLGTNGAQARLTFLGQYIATNLSHPAGDFANAFQVVNGVQMSGTAGQYQYQVRLRMTKRTPGKITASTPNITMTIRTRGFSGLNGNENCNADFNISVMR